MFADSSELQHSPEFQSVWHHGGHPAWNLTSLRVTGFDRVYSFLLAAILLVAFVAAGLLTIWLTSGATEFGHKTGAPGGGTLVIGPDESVNNPVEDFVEPDFLEATTEDLSTVLASMPAAVESTMDVGIGGGDDQIGRDPNPLPDPAPSTTSFTRWRIEYQSTDLAHYRRQLAGLGIELGVVFQLTNEITRLTSLEVDPIEKIKSDRAAEVDSVYFVPLKKWLRAWDNQIALTAGAQQPDSFVVHFLDQRRVQQMLEMEQSFAANASRSVDEIRQTIFRVVESNDQFKMELSEVTFMEVPSR